MKYIVLEMTIFSTFHGSHDDEDVFNALMVATEVEIKTFSFT